MGALMDMSCEILISFYYKQVTLCKMMIEIINLSSVVNNGFIKVLVAQWIKNLNVEQKVWSSIPTGCNYQFGVFVDCAHPLYSLIEVYKYDLLAFSRKKPPPNFYLKWDTKSVLLSLPFCKQWVKTNRKQQTQCLPRYIMYSGNLKFKI